MCPEFIIFLIVFMPKEKNYFVIGRFAKPYGVRGWIKVVSFTEPTENILAYPQWKLQLSDTQWADLDVEHKKPYNNKFLLVKLKNCGSPEEASAYTNGLIAVDRGDLPELKSNEYYWVDLIGLTVFNTQGVCYGRVTSLLATGANDVLVILKEDSSEMLIPYLSSVVKSVDLSQQQMVVDWEE